MRESNANRHKVAQFGDNITGSGSCLMVVFHIKVTEVPDLTTGCCLIIVCYAELTYIFGTYYWEDRLVQRTVVLLSPSRRLCDFCSLSEHLKAVIDNFILALCIFRQNELSNMTEPYGTPAHYSVAIYGVAAPFYICSFWNSVRVSSKLFLRYALVCQPVTRCVETGIDYFGESSFQARQEVQLCCI